MTSSPAQVGDQGLAPIAAPWRHLFAWTILALVNTVALSVFVPWPKAGSAVRLAHHFFDIGNLLALGCTSACAVFAWTRLGPNGAAASYVARFAAACAAGYVFLPESLAGLTRKLGGEDGRDANLFLLIGAGALLVVLAGAASAWLARPRLRLLSIGVAVLAALGNHRVLPNAYPGLHLWIAWICAVVIACSLRGAVPPPMLARGNRLFRGAVLVLVGFVAIVSMAYWPRNAVVIELFRSPGTILTPYLARVHFEDAEAYESASVDPAWFEPRTETPPIPAGPPIIPRNDLLVILLTIDAVRADIVDHPEWSQVMPELQQLRADSVEFSEARSTGAQTVYTLATLFAGKHFSQLYWSPMGEETLTGELWPWADPSPRLGELLQKHGIKTVTMASASWLQGESGVVRGFDVEQRVRANTNRSHNMPTASGLMTPALATLQEHTSGPLFLFMHFMDPHAPYNLGGRAPTALGRYAKEIGTVGTQIRNLIDVLKATNRWSNTVLIVTADHGEAFGEHGTEHHATTLYEELLRVPLWIRAPGVAAGAVAEPVSTIDIGPTILDLFGIETPGSFMGESLVPLLRGEDVTLTRPIVAEGRLKQALITRQGIKAIRDLRKGTLEAYDLKTDPGELENIYWTDQGKDALNRLRLFFRAHTYERDGYEVPYRK